MFSIPPELEIVLQKKYPQVNVRKLIGDFIASIMVRCIENGTCSIRGFGKFLIFQNFSKKLGIYTLKFKFRPSAHLMRKIRTDQGLLGKAKIVDKKPFVGVNSMTVSRTGKGVVTRHL